MAVPQGKQLSGDVPEARRTSEPGEIWGSDTAAERLIERPRYMQRLMEHVDTPSVKILTGIRRCGKSTLLTQLANYLAESRPEAIQVRVNLESRLGLQLDSPQAFLDYVSAQILDPKIRAYCFFDEIQQLPGWERAINALRVDYNCDIYLTGSNSSLLSGDLATHLAGRYVEIRVRPFSFSEYVRLATHEPQNEATASRTATVRTSQTATQGDDQTDSTTSQTNTKATSHLATRDSQMTQRYIQTDNLIIPPAALERLFTYYLRYGGFPMLSYFDFQDGPIVQYLENLYGSTVLKDVVEYHTIRDVDGFNRVVGYALGNIGKLFSANSLSRYFKNEGRTISVDTVLNYLEYCRRAFILDRAEVVSVPTKSPGKHQLRVNEKYYAADHGLRRALGYSNEADVELVLENLVYQELCSRGYHVSVGRLGDGEVDFVARKGTQIAYYQVCYLLAEPTTVEREFGVLRRIADNYPKYVLSLDRLDRSQDGIQQLYLPDFLLQVP